MVSRVLTSPRLRFEFRAPGAWAASVLTGTNGECSGTDLHFTPCSGNQEEGTLTGFQP